MKKIISMIAALAMMLAIVPTSFAEVTTTKPTISASAVLFASDEFQDLYDEPVPDGYDAYKVTFDISNITDKLGYTKTAGTNAKPKYSGIGLDKMEITLQSDVAVSKFYADYSYIVDSTWKSGFAATEGFTDDGWTMNFNSNFVYPAQADTYVEANSTIDDLFTVAFLVETGTTVNFSVVDAEIVLMEYTDGNVADSPNYKYSQDTLAMSSFKLGSTTPDPTPVGPTATAAGTSADGKITAYTIANDAAGDVDATEKVITKTFEGLTITDATRVYVTIDGEDRVFGSDLAEATNGLDIGKLTFGIIVKANVDLSKITEFDVR